MLILSGQNISRHPPRAFQLPPRREKDQGTRNNGSGHVLSSAQAGQLSALRYVQYSHSSGCYCTAFNTSGRLKSNLMTSFYNSREAAKFCFWRLSHCVIHETCYSSPIACRQQIARLSPSMHVFIPRLQPRLVCRLKPASLLDAAPSLSFCHSHQTLTKLCIPSHRCVCVCVWEREKERPSSQRQTWKGACSKPEASNAVAPSHGIYSCSAFSTQSLTGKGVIPRWSAYFFPKWFRERRAKYSAFHVAA